MSTSEWSYLVALDTSVDFVSDAPLDALSARVLLSNANLLCDEFAQVRLALTDKTGLAPNFSATGTLSPVAQYTFPISVKSDGSAYVFRIRLGGYVTGGATATIRAVIGPPTTTGSRYVLGGYGDREFVTASLGGSDAWLTGTSQGPAAYTTLITLPAALVTYVSTTTTTTVGGTSESVDVPTAQLSIYGTTTSIAHPPIITGIYLAEYIGL